jgi:hypothetical protein
VAAVAVVD